MAHIKRLVLLTIGLHVFGCGSGGSDSTSINQQPIDQKPVVLQLDKVNAEIIEIQVEPIDSMFVSGPENVIKSWNQQVLIPSSTGLNIFELDENGFINKSNKLLEITASVASVSGNIIAAHELNQIAFYDYDGESVSEIGRSEITSLRQVPLDTIGSCFYWVKSIDDSAVSSIVQEACYDNDAFIYNEIISSEIFISNILALPDNRIVITMGEPDRSIIQLYAKENGTYTLKSQVQEKSGWSFLDLEYRDNFLFVYADSSDVPGREGEAGLIRYSIFNDAFNGKLQLAEVITDNAQYDLIGMTPDGVMLADDKKLKHIIGSGQAIEKIVFTNIENSVSSVYYVDGYIITVLRDPPSSFSSGKRGSQGMHIYSYQQFLHQ